MRRTAVRVAHRCAAASHGARCRGSPRSTLLLTSPTTSHPAVTPVHRTGLLLGVTILRVQHIFLARAKVMCCVW